MNKCISILQHDSYSVTAEQYGHEVYTCDIRFRLLSRYWIEQRFVDL